MTQNSSEQTRHPQSDHTYEIRSVHPFYPPNCEEIGKQTQNSDPLEGSEDDKHSITFKLKDGLYLASCLEAFADEEFMLMNWVDRVIFYEFGPNDQIHSHRKTNLEHSSSGTGSRDSDPVPSPNSELIYNRQLANDIKRLYEEFQSQDSSQEQNQQSIRYLHTSQDFFTNQGAESTNQNLPNDSQGPQSSNTPLFKYTWSRNEIFEFIDESVAQGSSCMIVNCVSSHSLDHRAETESVNCSDSQSQVSQAISHNGKIGEIFGIAASYMMKTYRWSLYKTLEFLDSRVKGVRINQTVYDFLNSYETELTGGENADLGADRKEFCLTYNWDQYQGEADLLLRNTYLNSHNLVTLPSSFRVEGQNCREEKKQKRRKLQRIPNTEEAKANSKKKTKEGLVQSGIKPILKNTTQRSNNRSSRKISFCDPLVVKESSCNQMIIDCPISQSITAVPFADTSRSDRQEYHFEQQQKFHQNEQKIKSDVLQNQQQVITNENQEVSSKYQQQSFANNKNAQNSQNLKQKAQLQRKCMIESKKQKRDSQKICLSVQKIVQDFQIGYQTSRFLKEQEKLKTSKRENESAPSTLRKMKRHQSFYNVGLLETNSDPHRNLQIGEIIARLRTKQQKSDRSTGKQAFSQRNSKNERSPAGKNICSKAQGSIVYPLSPKDQNTETNSNQQLKTLRKRQQLFNLLHSDGNKSSAKPHSKKFDLNAQSVVYHKQNNFREKENTQPQKLLTKQRKQIATFTEENSKLTRIMKKIINSRNSLEA